MGCASQVTIATVMLTAVASARVLHACGWSLQHSCCLVHPPHHFLSLLFSPFSPFSLSSSPSDPARESDCNCDHVALAYAHGYEYGCSPVAFCLCSVILTGAAFFLRCGCDCALSYAPFR